MPLERFRWSALTNQQVGAYVEYFVKMELTMFGFQVYGSIIYVALGTLHQVKNVGDGPARSTSSSRSAATRASSGMQCSSQSDEVVSEK